MTINGLTHAQAGLGECSDRYGSAPRPYLEGASIYNRQIFQSDPWTLVFAAKSGNPVAPATFTFQVQDNGGVLNGGIDLDQSANTVTINITN